MADRGLVVAVGDFSGERLDLATIGRDFGWSAAQTPDVSGLREITRSRTVIAVLIQAGAPDMPWPKALRAVRATAPRARIILCHRVDQAHSRGEMINAGAFGVLLSPLAHSEVRQLLGFVWASKITPLPQVPSTASKTQPIDRRVQRVGAA
jgi:DNA-binding NarL/FixJ family response regulator